MQVVHEGDGRPLPQDEWTAKKHGGGGGGGNKEETRCSAISHHSGPGGPHWATPAQWASAPRVRGPDPVSVPRRVATRPSSAARRRRHGRSLRRRRRRRRSAPVGTTHGTRDLRGRWATRRRSGWVCWCYATSSWTSNAARKQPPHARRPTSAVLRSERGLGPRSAKNSFSRNVIQTRQTLINFLAQSIFRKTFQLFAQCRVF